MTRTRVGLAMAVLAMSAAACGKTRDASTSDAVPCVAAPAPEIRIAAALPPGLDKGARESVSAEPFADASLLRLDQAGRPMPAMARSWHTSDRRTWTFTLREGLRSQNGAPLTASQIVELLRVALKEDTFFAPIWRDLEGIDAPTPTTVVIRLSRPNSALIEALGTSRLATAAHRPDLYAGPFRLVHDAPAEMIYEPFPQAWTGPPTVRGLRLRFFPSPRTAWAAFLRDEADMLLYDIPWDALPLLMENQDVQLFNTGSRYSSVLTFQQRHPLLRDPRVRQALNLAIDREAIARRFFRAHATPGNGPFPPTYWATEGAGSAWPYDPATARALLKEATGGGTRPIQLECLVVEPSPIHADIAAAIEAQLAQVHVQLRIVMIPMNDLNRRMLSGDFELLSTPLATGYGMLGAMFFWHSPPVFLKSHYSAADPALDALMSASSDDEQRVAAGEVLEVMRRDPPAVFVMSIPSLRAVSRKWRVPADEPDIRRSLPYWTLAEATPCSR